MKYIRTKDTIFKVVEETDIIYKVVAKNKKNTYSKSKCQTYVLESADTIEKLCDEFVVVGVPNRTFIIDEKDYKEQGLTLKQYVNFLYAQYSNCKVYGAIWTDKGLIYVAKLNDKGELELL